MSTSTTAYFEDGRHVDVPHNSVIDWKYAVANDDDTNGLADWYTDGGDENLDEIQGTANDDPRCQNEGSIVRVVNATQAAVYTPGLPHASAWTCGKRACVLDAMAWVERATGDTAVWLSADEQVHTVPPRTDFGATAPEYPLNAEAAAALMDEDGFAIFTIELDKNTFFEALGNSHIDTEDDTCEFLHDKVLSFGATYDSNFEAVAIDGEIVTVEYTTNVQVALGMGY
jgi:hypothetical protein